MINSAVPLINTTSILKREENVTTLTRRNWTPMSKLNAPVAFRTWKGRARDSYRLVRKQEGWLYGYH